MKILSSYKNGNYEVSLFSDGTKIRHLPKNEIEFIPDFPENIDVKISNRCSLGCEFCHENSTCNGKIASGLDQDFYISCSSLKHFLEGQNNFNPKSYKLHSKNNNLNNFISSLKPGTELAVGGGALSEIGDPLFLFLEMVTDQGVYPNITVNGKELLNNFFYSKIITSIAFEGKRNAAKVYTYLQNHRDLAASIANEDSMKRHFIYGLGISYVDDPVVKERMLVLRRFFPNSVIIHTIYGITKKEDYDWLAENGFKVLVLGYKNFRRGETYKKKYENEILSNMKDFDENFKNYAKKCHRISFDCLATEQFNLKEKISKNVWDLRYMGDDGKFTMYVDLVEGKFAMNSTIPEDNRYSCEDFSFNVSLMFKKIRNN